MGGVCDTRDRSGIRQRKVCVRCLGEAEEKEDRIKKAWISYPRTTQIQTVEPLRMVWGVWDWAGCADAARDKGTHTSCQKANDQVQSSHSLGGLRPLLGMGEEQRSQVPG